MQIEYVLIGVFAWLLYSFGYWIGSYFERQKWQMVQEHEKLLLAGLKQIDSHLTDTLRTAAAYKTQMDTLLVEGVELFAMVSDATRYQQEVNRKLKEDAIQKPA